MQTVIPDTRIQAVRDVNSLPNITAPRDNPTFANMFNEKIENCLLSKRLLDSSAIDDIVVNEPQNPMATRSEYFGSRFQIKETIEKTPRTKLPSMFMAKTLALVFCRMHKSTISHYVEIMG